MYKVYNRDYKKWGANMTTEAQKKANAKYKEKMKGKYVELRYKVTPEERDEIKAYCEAKKVAVSDFTRELVLKIVGEK